MFTEMVERELIRARNQHSNMHSGHEGWAVIQEEVEELWDEVKKHGGVEVERAMLAEVVQIGAMCQRFAEDVLKVEQPR